MAESRQQRRERARRRREAPPGVGRLQALAVGEPGEKIVLDERALKAALEPFLQQFGLDGGRMLTVLWTYAPLEAPMEALAVGLANDVVGSVRQQVVAQEVPLEDVVPLLPFVMSAAGLHLARESARAYPERYERRSEWPDKGVN